LEGHDIDLQRAAELSDSLGRAQLQALSMGRKSVNEPAKAVAASPDSTNTDDEHSPFVTSPKPVAALRKERSKAGKMFLLWRTSAQSEFLSYTRTEVS